MRLSNRQHPLHLQVTRTNNGKFLVNPNELQHQQQQQDVSPTRCDESNRHNRQLQRQQIRERQRERSREHEQHLPVLAPIVPPVVFPSCESLPTADSRGTTLVGDRFLLIGPAEGTTLYRCVDVRTNQQFVAKALSTSDRGGEALLQAHVRLADCDAVSSVAGIIDAPCGKRYLLLEGHYGDLHAYVRARRRLREPEARRLFRQAVKAVAKCHENGVILRDLKLRKFVFADSARTRLRLESLEDAVIVDVDDDKLTDRRGCPAYVAPEVLRSGKAYSGKAADVWSCGVLLYTMLVGRYPFNDPEHAMLFAKISRGQFVLPETLSPRAKCLIRSLLRREPSERPDSIDVPLHPWLSKPIINSSHTGGRSSLSQDQIVPEMTNHYQD